MKVISGKESLFLRLKNQKTVFKFAVSVLLVFIAIYQPPLPISVIYLIAGVSIGYICLLRRIEKEAAIIIFMLVLSAAYVGALGLINMSPINNGSSIFWIAAATIPAGVALASFNYGFDFDGFFHIVLTASLIQTFIVFLSFFNDDVRQVLFNMMSKYGLYSRDHLAKWGFRIYGYGVSLMYGTPVVQGVIAAWSVLYGLLKKRNIYFVYALLIIFSAIICAKISIFIFVAVLGVNLLVFKKCFSKTTLRLIVFVALFVFLAHWAVSFLADKNQVLSDWISLISSSETIDKFYFSYYTDLGKYQLPDGFGAVFGIGSSAQQNGIDADIGFVNDWWFGGLPYYLVVVSVIYKLVMRIRNRANYPLNWEGIIVYSFLITIALANIKGGAFSYGPILSFFVIVSFFTCYEEKNSYQFEEQDKINDNIG